MSWNKWSTKTHHGKERTTSSDGKTKTEYLVGKTGEPYSAHVSVTTKSNGTKFAMSGPHTDKKS